MRRSRVTGGTARSMAVATIRTVRWIVVDSPGSRVLRTAMAADMGSVLKLDNSLKSSSHRLTSRSRTTRPLSANTTGSCRRSRHLVSENSQTPRRWPSGTSLPTRSDTRSIRACRGGSLRRLPLLRLPLLPDRTDQIADLNIGAHTRWRSTQTRLSRTALSGGPMTVSGGA